MYEPLGCRQFAHFAAVVAEAPGQCLRYCFDEGAEPLWPSCKHIPTPQDIPPCQHCGTPRRFEFQVIGHTLPVLAITLAECIALSVTACMHAGLVHSVNTFATKAVHKLVTAERHMPFQPW